MLLSNSNAAVGRLAFTETFDYDFWIKEFRAAPRREIERQKLEEEERKKRDEERTKDNLIRLQIIEQEEQARKKDLKDIYTRNNKAPAVAPIVKVDQATELGAFIKELVQKISGDMKPWNVDFKDCFSDTGMILVAGTQFTVRDGKAGISSDGRQLALNTLVSRAGHAKGVEIQKRLLNHLEGMVVPVYYAEFPADKDDQCKQRFTFEDIYGEALSITKSQTITDELVLRVAARGLEVLKKLHSLGLVHRKIRDGLVWNPGNVESIRLRFFGLAKVYFDSIRGQHVPVPNCKGGSRHDGLLCPSTVVDLTQFSITLTKLSAAGATADLVAAFKEAVDSLGFTETFDYDFWINIFRQESSAHK